MNLGFDPTQVDWNDPSVEYLLKYFKMTMTDRDDKLESLARSNNQLASEKETDGIQEQGTGRKVLAP